MTEFFEDFIRHPRALVKTVIAVVTIIGLIFKVAVPKIKEKKSRLNDVKSSSGGTESLLKGIALYNEESFDEGAELMVKSLEQGISDLQLVNTACKMLIHYYHNKNEVHNSMRWARFALDNNCSDEEILSYMIDMYNRMGETAKAEELKELIKNS